LCAGGDGGRPSHSHTLLVGHSSGGEKGGRKAWSASKGKKDAGTSLGGKTQKKWEWVIFHTPRLVVVNDHKSPTKPWPEDKNKFKGEETDRIDAKGEQKRGVVGNSVSRANKKELRSPPVRGVLGLVMERPAKGTGRGSDSLKKGKSGMGKGFPMYRNTTQQGSKRRKENRGKNQEMEKEKNKFQNYFTQPCQGRTQGHQQTPLYHTSKWQSPPSKRKRKNRIEKPKRGKRGNGGRPFKARGNGTHAQVPERETKGGEKGKGSLILFRMQTSRQSMKKEKAKAKKGWYGTGKVEGQANE